MHSYINEDRDPRITNSIGILGPLVVCALAGFLSGFTVSLVGQLPIGELVLMLVAPFMLFRLVGRRGWPARLQQLGWFKILLVLVGVMAAGYIGSDLYRGTTYMNAARGWARVFFLALDLVTIVFLINESWRRLYIFVFALYFARSVEAFAIGEVSAEWWKFGVGYTLTAVSLFALGGRGPIIQVVVALILSGINLALGARSLGGICLLTGGLLWLRHARGVFKPLALLTATVATVVMFIAANRVFLENQDHVGSNIERQSMIETAAELFISSPLVGQGSWFTVKRIGELETRRARVDPSFRGYSEEEARKISIHSQLLTGLAEAGILGGAFFLCLGALLLKTLVTLVNNSVPHRAFLFYLIIAGLWNLCMTPFSGVTRVELALAISACLLVILQLQGEILEKHGE